MTEFLQRTKPPSLWECLHDGSVVSFESDFVARTLTIVIDSAYHWEFHKLPANTRFRISGENVRIAEVFDFEPWLGAMSYPNSNYRTVRVHAEQFHFRVGERELSLEEFQEFGTVYWNNFAQKSKVQSVEAESA
jgi:hypothetical protein